MSERATMDEIRTVDELLEAKKVTAEEREFLKDIIETARKNERQIKEYAAQMRTNLSKLSLAVESMEERTFVLNKALQNLLESASSLQLRLMPSDKFYRE
jgi:hypothetical protein